MVSELEKQESKRQEAEPGEVQVMHQEKVFHLEGGWAIEQGSGYSTKS